MELDTQDFENKVAKEIEDMESAKASTPEETPKEEVKTDESTRTETSIKTEDEPVETKEEPKEEVKEIPKEENKEDESRFDKHPRFQKLMQERDEALEKAKRANEIESKLEGTDPDELLRIKEAAKMLRKYPELAEKVQKLIDEHPYQNEEVMSKFNEINQKLEQQEMSLALEKYDSTVDKLITNNKLDDSTKDLVRELLDNRVVAKKLGLKDVPNEFANILKSVNSLQRKTITNHIETRKAEPKVPASTTSKGQVKTVSKVEQNDEDFIGNLAEELKKNRAEI